MNMLLNVQDLHVGYGHVAVIQGISINIPEGGFVAIVGSNGSGKSTLLRALSGLLKPTAGSIVFGGLLISGETPSKIVRSGLLHVAEGRRLFKNQSVKDNLDLGLWGLRLSTVETAARYDRVYSLFPVLHERRDVRAGILSGGQQQMLALGQALMQQPRLLMLDEPSLGLAPAIIDQLFDAVVSLRQEGTTILLVEQMVERALQIADTAYVMQNGLIIGKGPAAELQGSELVRNAYLGSFEDTH